MNKRSAADGEGQKDEVKTSNKETLYPVMTLAEWSTESLNVAVSDTTKVQ